MTMQEIIRTLSDAGANFNELIAVSAAIYHAGESDLKIGHGPRNRLAEWIAEDTIAK